MSIDMGTFRSDGPPQAGGWRTDDMELPATRQELARLLVDVASAHDLASIIADGSSGRIKVMWRPNALQKELGGGSPSLLERSYQSDMQELDVSSLLAGFQWVDRYGRVVCYIVVSSKSELTELLRAEGLSDPFAFGPLSPGQPIRLLGAEVTIDPSITPGNVLLYHSTVRARPEWCDILRIATLPEGVATGGDDVKQGS